ncbi:MAG TPA: hypothetical protein VGQ76_18830 [Thermoanaerobaculia bacterium]|jgi:hypothetical protein|nr:hypothetical protein [Thermoanaerobaculia bacterium]
MKKILTVLAAVAFVVNARTSTPVTAPLLATTALAAPDLKAAETLAFGPDNVLFIGDSQSASVFAVDVKDTAKDTASEPLNVPGIDAKIASLLGTTADAIVINDLAVHPASQNVYLAVSRGRGNDARPVLLRVTRKGEFQEVALAGVPFSKVSIANAPEPGSKTTWGADKRRMTITDLAFVDGELLIAGLSNTEFASTLRRAAYPFKDALAINTLEIYHTSHDRYETYSPIESFLPLTISGRPSLLAGYGCAPIASFALADLKTKQHLRGTTLAELGGGNRPLDMVSFTKEGQRRVLIANSNRTLMSMSATDIEKAKPMTTAVDAAYVSAGVPYVSIAQVGITQLDNLNDGFVVVVQRDIDDGTLNLASLSKKWL